MGEPTSRTEPTVAAPGDGDADHEADLEITALHPSSHATRFLRAQHFGDARLRHVMVSVLLLGLALVLVVVTPLPRAFWSLVTPPASATIAVTATATATVSLSAKRAAVTATAKTTPGAEQPGNWRAPQAWSALEARPLHFPTLGPSLPCPVSPVQLVLTDLGLGLGSGPIYPYSFTPDGQSSASVPPRQTASGVVPGFYEVMWAMAPTYRGGVLVRGAQLDGQHPVAFNGGYAQITYQGDWADAPLLNELQLVSFPDDNVQWIVYGSEVRLESPGCYAFQLDGSTFSYILIFRAEG